MTSIFSGLVLSPLAAANHVVTDPLAEYRNRTKANRQLVPCVGNCQVMTTGGEDQKQ